jgi:uncharacterized MAPEG superfamily protein
MKAELITLTEVSLFTAVLWMPYVLNRIAVRGIVATVGYPDTPAPLAPWAQRLRAAHANAVENLVLFAALVLIAHGAGVSNSVTVLAGQLYLWSRIGHAIAYTFAIPWIRTLAFFAGFVAQMLMAWQLLATF